MRTLSRRQILLRSTGMLATFPSILHANDIVHSTESKADIGVVFAVAELRRGLLVDQIRKDELSHTPIFQAASLAKPVVASLVLKQSLRGKLDLDQPLSELLPDGYEHRQNLFAIRETPIVDVVPQAVLKRLTARHLLSHTSGFPNWSSRAPLKPAFEPGTRWGYSGEGYVLLQRILQLHTGLSLNALASVELFEPLRMHDTAFMLTDRIARSLVPGRAASGQIRQLRFPYEIAAGSLYTSAADYGRFIEATLQDQALLNLVLTAPVPVQDATGVYWGLGWGIEHQQADRTIWHWGNNPGFRALAMANLKSKDAVVVLTATEAGMPQAKEIVRQTLPGTHPGLNLNLVQ